MTQTATSTPLEAGASTQLLADAPETVPTLEQLQEQLRAAEDWRCALINAAHKYAQERNFCPEFETVMARVGLPKRQFVQSMVTQCRVRVVPPADVDDVNNYGCSDEFKVATLDVLEAAIAKAREGDWSGFLSGPTHYSNEESVLREWTREDFIAAPMRVLKNGKASSTVHPARGIERD